MIGVGHILYCSKTACVPNIWEKIEYKSLVANPVVEGALERPGWRWKYITIFHNLCEFV
jgi:hypothetical protein